VQAELIKGSNGIYEVAVDGSVVASKGFLGFPSDDQVTKAVQEALNPRA
jgi:selenoprotein W-related protein